MKQIFLFVVSIMFFSGALKAYSETKLPDSYAFTRGVEAFQNGQNQDAMDWFTKELDEHPKNGYAYLYISAIRYGNNEYGKALSAINEAMKNLPKKDKEYAAVAYATRSGIYLAMEDTVTAINDMDAAIKFDPDNKNHYNRRGQIYFEQGKYDLSDADYRHMISLDPGDVTGYMGIGRNAKEQGRYEDALEQFNYVIKMEPDYSSGYAFRAEVYLSQKKYSEAVDDLIKALGLNDRKAYYHLTFLDEEAIPVAKAKLQIQANKEPNDAMWPYYIGLMLERNNRQREAVPYYEEAHNRDANSVFLERISNCYFDLGDYASALDYVNRGINMDSEDDDLIMLKGNILNEMGEHESAIANLDQYIEKNPDNYFGYYRRGWFKDEAGDTDGAIDDYTMAIILEPEYAYAYCGRGRFYHEQGKEDLARADFEKVLELDTVPSTNSCAQYAYLFLGQRDKAVAFMDSIIASDSDKAGNYYDAACLYSLMGEKQTAIDYLKRAFENGYRRFAHIKADHDMDNIREMPEFKELIQSYSDAGVNAPDTQEANDAQLEVVEVPFSKEGGVTKVKCTINGLPLHFVFDTGAAEVTLSMVEANFMLKNDYIKPSDIVGTSKYMDANGDISEGTVINLRSVDFGGLDLANVRASVVRNQRAPLLLGQSVLGRLGKIEIDNPGQKLIITHKNSRSSK